MELRRSMEKNSTVKASNEHIQTAMEVDLTITDLTPVNDQSLDNEISGGNTVDKDSMMEVDETAELVFEDELVVEKEVAGEDREEIQKVTRKKQEVMVREWRMMIP